MCRTCEHDEDIYQEEESCQREKSFQLKSSVDGADLRLISVSRHIDSDVP